MGKQDAKGDMFGMDNDDVADEGHDGNETYMIAQIVPADGWKAIFMEPPGSYRTLGLACFALVEFIPDNPEVAQIPSRAVRPMVVDEFGEIEDVGAFDTFLCCVPPNQDSQAMIDIALERRARENQQ